MTAAHPKRKTSTTFHHPGAVIWMKFKHVEAEAFNLFPPFAPELMLPSQALFEDNVEGTKTCSRLPLEAVENCDL